MVVRRGFTALSILALMPVAALAADVSIYGSANVELGMYKDGRPDEVIAVDDVPFTKIRLEDNTRGRFGIKASEDLGGGVSSFARFEWEVSTVTNTLESAAADTSPSLTQRMSYVGIASKFGSVLAGNLLSPYKYTGGVKYDPFVATALEARGNGGMTGGALGHEDFLKKMVSYELPREGLVSGRIAYGVEDGDGALSLDVLAKWRGWEAFVAYIDSGNREYVPDTTPVASAAIGYSAAKVGGQFRSDSGAHQISLQYESVKDESTVGTTVKPSVWFLGYQFKYEKAVLAAQIGSSTKKAYTTIKTDYAVLGAIYKFTPDTRIYTGYRYSKDVDQVFTFGLRKDFRT